MTSRINLGQLAKIKHGYAFSGDLFSEEPTQDILVTPGNFKIGGGFKKDKLKYYNGHVPSDYILNPYDLIVTMTDLSKEGDTLGFPAMVPNDPSFRYLHNQRIGRVIFKEETLERIDIKYIYFLMCSKEYRDEILSSATGATVKHTAPERIEKFSFQLPDLREQKIISNYLSCIEDKIDNNARLIKTLESMAQTYYKEWFENYSFPDCNDLNYVESGHTDFGNIPIGWAIKPLGEICYINSESFRASDLPEKIKYIDIASVGTGTLEPLSTIERKDAPGRAKRKLKHGDTIWSCVRPNRRSFAYISNPKNNWVASTGLAVLTSKTNNPAFLYCLTTTQKFSSYLASQAQGVAYPAVKAEDFYNAPVLLPPDTLVKKFDQLVAPMLDLKNVLIVENENLALLRSLILPKLISGEITAKDISYLENEQSSYLKNASSKNQVKYL